MLIQCSTYSHLGTMTLAVHCLLKSLSPCTHLVHQITVFKETFLYLFIYRVAACLPPQPCTPLFVFFNLFCHMLFTLHTLQQQTITYLLYSLYITYLLTVDYKPHDGWDGCML